MEKVAIMQLHSWIPPPNPTSQPMHTHPYHAIANWWEILPVSREGAPLDGVGGLRHGNLENTSVESLISDIRPCVKARSGPTKHSRAKK